jgi:hypothetical protein
MQQLGTSFDRSTGPEGTTVLVRRRRETKVVV